jgi:hypothetical protein
MPLAGEAITAGKIPGERVATTTRTSNSGTFTSETVLDTVVAPVVAGRTYRVRWVCAHQSTVGTDVARLRLREDSVAGTQLQLDNVSFDANSQIVQRTVEAQYVADATEDKTFVATSARLSGSGNISSTQSATQPALLYVEFIEE